MWTGCAEPSQRRANQGITNSVINAASQTMFPMIATSRTQSATTAVRLAIFIVSASKKKSGRRNVIRTNRVSRRKKNAKVKQRYSQWLRIALKTLELVLARLKKYGLKVNPSKCKFFQDSVVFYAHRIVKDGIHKMKDKIEAIINASRW